MYMRHANVLIYHHGLYVSTDKRIDFPASKHKEMG